MVWIKLKDGRHRTYMAHLAGTYDRYRLLGFDNHYYLIDLEDVEINCVIRTEDLRLALEIAIDNDNGL
jgi:hypothetical protein